MTHVYCQNVIHAQQIRLPVQNYVFKIRIMQFFSCVFN